MPIEGTALIVIAIGRDMSRSDELLDLARSLRSQLKSLAREFPCTVETAMPEGELGHTLDRMYEFHVLRGIKAQSGAGRRVDDCDIVTWLFADPAVAQDFAFEFGGSMILPPNCDQV